MGIENLDVLSDPNEEKPKNIFEDELREHLESEIQAVLDNSPHPVEENAEELAGEVTKDPWNDETQTDWPQNVTAPVEAPEEVV